jgi:hypothetical protein
MTEGTGRRVIALVWVVVGLLAEAKAGPHG